MSTQFTQSQIYSQNQRFEQAYALGQAHPELVGVPNSGAISKAQYEQVMSVQHLNAQANLNAVLGGNAPENVKISTVTALPTSDVEAQAAKSPIYVSPEQKQQLLSSIAFYSKAGYSQFGGKYAPINVPSGRKIASISEVAVPFVGPVKDESKRPAPQKQLEFSFVSNGQPSALDNAKQQLETLGNFRMRANVRQGTSPTGPTIGQITQGLSEQDKQSFYKYQDDKVTAAMLNTGLFLTSSFMLPILGPTGAVIAITSGVGISEGASKLTTGNWLSPREVLQAAEMGVIFAGAGGFALKGASAGLTYFGSKTGSLVLGNAAKTLMGAGVVQHGSKGLMFVSSGLKSTAARAAFNFGFGSSTTYALSGGDVKQSLVSGGIGAGFSLGFETAGIVIGSKLGSLINRGRVTVNQKVLVGGSGSETENVGFVGSREIVDTSRFVRLHTETNQVKVSKDYLSWLNRFNKAFSPEKVVLEGTQRSTLTVKEAAINEGVPKVVPEFVNGAVVEEYMAKPFMDSLKGKPSTTVEQFATKDLKGLRVITTTPNEGEVTIQSTVKGDVIPDSVAKINKDLGIVGTHGLSEKTFFSAKLWGSIDADTYTSLLRTVTPNVEGSGGFLEIKPNEKMPSRDWLRLKGSNQDVIKSAGYLNEAPLNKSLMAQLKLEISDVGVRTRNFLGNPKAAFTRTQDFTSMDSSNKIAANFEKSQLKVQKGVDLKEYAKVTSKNIRGEKPFEGYVDKSTGKVTGYSKGSRIAQDLEKTGGLPYKQMGGLAASQLEELSTRKIPVYTNILETTIVTPKGITAPSVSWIVSHRSGGSPTNIFTANANALRIIDTTKEDLTPKLDDYQRPGTINYQEPIIDITSMTSEVIDFTVRDVVVSDVLSSFKSNNKLPPAFPFGSGGGGGEIGGGIFSRRGKFVKRLHAIPTPKRELQQVLGKRKISVIKLKSSKERKKKRKASKPKLKSFKITIKVK